MDIAWHGDMGENKRLDWAVGWARERAAIESEHPFITPGLSHHRPPRPPYKS
jgi:hypothetical protein